MNLNRLTPEKRFAVTSEQNLARLRQAKENALRRRWWADKRKEYFTEASARFFYPGIADRYDRVISALSIAPPCTLEEVKKVVTPNAWATIQSIGSFSTQTQPEHYRDVLADWWVSRVKRLGLNARIIVPAGRPSYRHVQVEGLAVARWLAAVEWHDAREFVRFCWSRQAQPRVFNPFLPDDFEQKNRLDYHGNEIPKGQPWTAWCPPKDRQ